MYKLFVVTYFLILCILYYIILYIILYYVTLFVLMRKINCMLYVNCMMKKIFLMIKINKL